MVMLKEHSVATVKLDGYRCVRCEHEWVPRQKGQVPLVCPSCKSPYWNRPRRGKKKRDGEGPWLEVPRPSSND